MQPTVRCQEPRGFGREGVWRWKAPSAIIQAVPTQARNTKRCQMLYTLLQIAISSSVSLFANTELRERESRAYLTPKCLLLSAAKAEMSKSHVPVLSYKRT